MAARIGVTQPAYSRYEHGRIPDYDVLSTIADRFGISVDWLMGRTDDPAHVAGEHSPVVKDMRNHAYGTLPAAYTVRWHPQWNGRLADMPRDQICDLIEASIAGLRTKLAGDPLAHLCHYLMDLLNELANRKPEEGPP